MPSWHKQQAFQRRDQLGRSICRARLTPEDADFFHRGYCNTADAEGSSCGQLQGPREESPCCLKPSMHTKSWPRKQQRDSGTKCCRTGSRAPTAERHRGEKEPHALCPPSPGATSCWSSWVRAVFPRCSSLGAICFCLYLPSPITPISGAALASDVLLLLVRWGERCPAAPLPGPNPAQHPGTHGGAFPGSPAAPQHGEDPQLALRSARLLPQPSPPPAGSEPAGTLPAPAALIELCRINSWN